jgi:hypothetical protein
MTTDNAEINLADTQYYRVICVLSEVNAAGKWQASIRVKRSDTGEYVKAGFAVSGQNKEEALTSAIKRVNDSLLPQLDELGEPTEWRTQIRQVILQCKNLKAQIVEFGSYIAEGALSGGNVEGYWDRYAVFWKNTIKESIALGGNIERLTEEDRISLLTLPEEALKDPSDAWSLEELDSRIMAFEFFLMPTEREQLVHEAQKRRLSDRFKELGWD